MTKDIVPELLEKIKDDFEKDFNKSDLIDSIYKKIKNGSATYQEANKFAVETGEILSKTLQKHIKSDALPDGKMYYNIANRVLGNTLDTNHKILAETCKNIQTQLNKNAGLGIKGIAPELNQDRIDGLVEKIVSYDDFDKAKWLLDEPIVNFNQAIVNKAIETNADFHHKLGMQPKIIRKPTGHCCDWCQEVAGVYEYPNVPKNVYRVHRRCRCTVDYVTADGKVQNVHSKQILDKDALEKRINLSNKKTFRNVNEKATEKYQSKSDEAYSYLNVDEREALKEYTTGGYNNINLDLSEGKESWFADNINSAMDKFILDDDVITYKGTRLKYYKKYKIGDEFEPNILNSTSFSEKQAQAFYDDIRDFCDDKPAMLEIQVPKNAKSLYIGNNTNYDGNEFELLLSNKLKYKVKDIQGDRYILEVLNNE